MRFDLQQQRAQVRHEVHRDDPRQHQRDHRHGKDGKGVFAGHRFGDADRQKPAAVISVPVSMGMAGDS